MTVSTNPEVWIAGIFTVAMFSFLYKENIVFRYAENIFVGFGGAHALVLGYQNIKDAAVIPLIEKGQYSQLIPIAIGLLLFARFVKGGRPLSNIPSAFLYGLGAATALRGIVLAQVVQQVAETIMVPKSIDDVVMILGVLLSLSYFVFTYSHLTVVEKMGRLGRAFIMVAFGAQFGNYVMGRASTMIGRLNFILADWLGIISQ